jgi:hypothetical protein
MGNEDLLDMQRSSQKNSYNEPVHDEPAPIIVCG